MSAFFKKKKIISYFLHRKKKFRSFLLKLKKNKISDSKKLINIFKKLDTLGKKIFRIRKLSRIKKCIFFHIKRLNYC